MAEFRVHADSVGTDLKYYRCAGLCAWSKKDWLAGQYQMCHLIHHCSILSPDRYIDAAEILAMKAYGTHGDTTCLE